jgi:hypothetical protein
VRGRQPGRERSCGIQPSRLTPLLRLAPPPRPCGSKVQEGGEGNEAVEATTGASGGKHASTSCPRSGSNRMRQKARAHRASAARSGGGASAQLRLPRPAARRTGSASSPRPPGKRIVGSGCPGRIGIGLGRTPRQVSPRRRGGGRLRLVETQCNKEREP